MSDLWGIGSPRSSLGPVGVYGGTFDPVHLGHLRSALEVMERLALQRVLMIPAHDPPHRGPPGASAAQRLEMLQLALAGVPGLQADDCELRRPGPSYMVDTLDGLRGRFPGQPLVLILGWDQFLELSTWHRWRQLPELAHIAVMQRPGASGEPPDEIAALLKQQRTDDIGALTRQHSGLIYRLPVTQLAISATAIRKRVAEGGDPRFLLPDPVRDYLLAQRLYARTAS